MPVQTTKTTYIDFGDGCVVNISTDDFATTTDLGAIRAGSTAVLNYEETEFETGNAGILNTRITNMTMAMDFDLLNVDPDDLTDLGGGIFTQTDESGAVTPDDQTIAAGWTAEQVIHLLPESGGIVRKFTTTPVITSVTNDVTPGAADDDYFVFADPNSPSGYSMYMLTDGTNTFSTSDATVIVYASNTMVTRTTLTSGTSSATITPIGLQFVHTDSNSYEKGIRVYSAKVNSGAFQFMWKGANEDDANSMPFSLTAKIDTSRTDGQQLLTFWRDAGYSS